MIQNWFLLTIIAGFSSNVFNYINRHVLKDHNDATSYAWWFEFFRLLIFLPFFLLTFDFRFSLYSFIIFLVIGFTEFFSVYFYMKMHSASELSISTTVSQLRLVWVPLLAFFLLREKLSIQEYAGIILILSGQVITTFKSNLTIDKGVKFALISSVFAALNNIVFKIASAIFSAPAITVAMAIPTILIFPLKMKESEKRLISLGRKRWRKILTASVFNSVAMLFLIFALKSGSVGKVTAVFQSMMVLQVFTGIIFLKERSDLIKKLSGIAVVFSGILLLI